MSTLLYHWNFTGDNDLNVNDEFYDSVSNLVAKVKRRGTYSSLSFSRSEHGISLNNDDSTNGGYYIDLEGLNSKQLGGNISIEMVVNNNNTSIKSIYFSSIGEVEKESGIVNGAALTARFNGSTKILVRPDEVANVTYPNYRNVSESSTTVISQNTETHYIFSVHYDSNGSSLKIYIDGDKKGENDADLEKELVNDARNTNFIGTRKVEDGATYLNGVVKYLKIYQNSMTDTNASSIYNDYNNSPYFSNINNESNTKKYSRRHTDVASYFSENAGVNEFSINGNQLGLSKSTKSYKIYRFTSGSQINISDTYNYFPLTGKDKFIILKYNITYFKITQTSVVSNENSQYKCEISTDGETYSLECENKGFGDTYSYNNIQVIFGGVEFLVNNEICFHEDTIIETDQGDIEIKNLKPNNTIRDLKIISLLKSNIYYNILVLIKKNAFMENYPNRDILITEEHLILINNSFIPAGKLIDNKNVLRVKNNSDVYNIILENENYIRIGNLNFNVLGVSKEVYNKIIENKKNGIKEMDLKFSRNTSIKLDLNKFLN